MLIGINGTNTIQPSIFMLTFSIINIVNLIKFVMIGGFLLIIIRDPLVNMYELLV